MADRRMVLRAATGAAILAGSGLAAAPVSAGRHRRRTVFVAGDSTAATYATADVPRAGWGQALGAFLDRSAGVVNEALSGASSKSFYDLGRLERILDAVRPGDWLLVSFGHNDAKDDAPRHTDPWTTFQDYLRLYLDGARAAGARPVLVTPVERRRFDVNGDAYESHGDYPASMRALAATTRTPLVDLTALSLAHWQRLGVEGTKSHFLWLPPGASPNYPDGVEDNTHFQAHGAIEVARIVVRELRALHGRDERALHDRDIPDDVLTWPPTRPAES